MRFHPPDIPPCFANLVVDIWPRSKALLNRQKERNIAAAGAVKDTSAGSLCQGLLLRDDLILTSFDCANVASHVEIVDQHRRRTQNRTAALLTTIQTKDGDTGSQHRLGLLQIDLP